MQKVEGSNPFSRFAEIPLPSGISSFRGSALFGSGRLDESGWWPCHGMPICEQGGRYFGGGLKWIVLHDSTTIASVR
jgi:hypothetical protein